VIKLSAFLEEETRMEGGACVDVRTGKRLAAVLPVHVFGNACDLDALMPICERHNLRVIEDASESLGTVYTGGRIAGRHTGTVGDIGCFSFNGNKIITTGGGGMLVTNNPDYAARLRYLTTQAKDDEVYFVHNEVGFNFRLTNIQAAVGVAQMEQLPAYLDIKRTNYRRYREALADLSWLEVSNTPSYAANNCWMYAVRLTADDGGRTRDAFMAYLAENRIQTRPLWHPNHLQKPYVGCRTGSIGLALDYHQRTVNIPCSVDLAESDIDNISNIIGRFADHK
jgi:dTDP-4-amino-4,6-dideoxygalactose transaminase